MSEQTFGEKCAEKIRSYSGFTWAKCKEDIIAGLIDRLDRERKVPALEGYTFCDRCGTQWLAREPVCCPVCQKKEEWVVGEIFNVFHGPTPNIFHFRVKSLQASGLPAECELVEVKPRMAVGFQEPKTQL